MASQPLEQAGAALNLVACIFMPLPSTKSRVRANDDVHLATYQRAERPPAKGVRDCSKD